MSLLVQKVGIYASFRDRGRFGYQKFGINPSGVMDRTAFRTGNALLQNIRNTAALEFGFPAPVLEFKRRISFVLSGADFCGTLNDEPIPRLRTIIAKRGSVLRFDRPISGNYAYLSVKNGFKLDQWLGSQTTSLETGRSGFCGRLLKKDDKIKFIEPETPDFEVGSTLRPLYAASPELRFIPGPSFEDLTALSELSLRNGSFQITKDSNRMGFRLSGTKLHLLDSVERLSSAVTFGTIQLLPDGQLIVLMADHQTSGGYPNLGTIISTDLPVAAQLSSGNSFRFAPCSIEMAENLYEQHERDYKFLNTAIKLRRSGS